VEGDAAPAERVAAELPTLGAGGVAVELRGVAKRYAGLEVDAQFERGRLAVVTGPSGSGKTTLLHLIAGLELPDAGEVLVLGQDVAALDRAGRPGTPAATIGSVGQQPGLIPHLSALENVELALALRDMQGDAREAL